MVNPSTHIMRCNKLIIFVGSYIHPQKKVYRKRKHGGSTLNESQVNERKVNHTTQYTPTGVFTSYTQRSDYMN